MPRKNTNSDNKLSENPPSRSAKKRESLALQKLGEELTRLTPAQLEPFSLSPELSDAIMLYQRITDREGRRRQMQFIGRLMRGLDPAPIQSALYALKDSRAKDVRLFQQAESLRNKLLACGEAELETALDEIYTLAGEKTQKDALRETLVKARAENGATGNPRYARELFRMIAALLSSKDAV